MTETLSQTETAPQDAGIHTVAADTFQRLADAWNRGDGMAYGEQFAVDADFVDIRGDHHRGGAAIGHGHQAIFDSIYAGSTVTYEIGVARPLGPGVVLAIATSTLVAPSGPLQGTHNSRTTVVVSEGDDGWSISALHNTLRTP
jgi:uncharacterized protein (TIGR02246 family)